MMNEDSFLTKSYKNDFVKLMGREVLSEMEIRKVDIYFSGGFKEDSFSSALMCGFVISIVESVYGFLSLKFDDVKMFKDIKPTFEENNLEFSFDLVISISLWRIVGCFFSAGKKIKDLKELKNEE